MQAATFLFDYQVALCYGSNMHTTKHDACGRCNGTGTDLYADGCYHPCHECRGTGRPHCECGVEVETCDATCKACEYLDGCDVTHRELKAVSMSELVHGGAS